MVKDVGVLVVDTRDLYQALFDEQLRQELVSAMKNKTSLEHPYDIIVAR